MLPSTDRNIETPGGIQPGDLCIRHPDMDGRIMVIRGLQSNEAKVLAARLSKCTTLDQIQDEVASFTGTKKGRSKYLLTDGIDKVLDVTLHRLAEAKDRTNLYCPHCKKTTPHKVEDKYGRTFYRCNACGRLASNRKQPVATES